MWCGVSSEKVYGSFFFAETARAVSYLDMNKQYVVPQLQQDEILDTIIYQQDGAPPHWTIIVKETLNHIFNDHWCDPSRFFCMGLRQVDSVRKMTTESG